MKFSLKNINLMLIMLFTATGCGIFGGVTLREDIETFEIKKFTNSAENIKPGLEDRFALKFEEHILNNTNLIFVTNKGDIVYEGEIIKFDIQPKKSTKIGTNTENRLSITVRVTFNDNKNNGNNLEKSYTAYYDYDNGLSLTDVEEEAYKHIFENIYDDIVNATILKW